VTYNTATVPTVHERTTAMCGEFRDPQREQRIIDFQAYQQIAMVEPLELIAGAIKEATNRTKIVTLFYGYYFEISGLPLGPQSSGHLALARLLKCPDVDIVCSPISYGDRGHGGIGAFMVPVDSVRDRGKLWLNEDDTRTYLTPENSGYGRVATPQHTRWVHQRNFAHLLPRRLACWYMDLGGIGWLAGQDIWDEINSLRTIYDEHLKVPAQWTPEVAVIVDEESPSYLACNPRIMRSLASVMRRQYYRMGAPFSMYLLSDLVAGRVPPAKIYLFVGCFHLDDAARRAVHEQTQGRTAVWFYGSGYLNDDASASNMSTLVGMPLKEVPSTKNGMVTYTDTGHPLTAGLADVTFGTDQALSPLWTVEEGDGVHVLGRFKNGQPAVVAKGRSLYIGTTDVPSALFRNILKTAGVHVYIDTPDVLLTDGRFLSITASQAGPKAIRLPAPACVRSLPSGEVWHKATDRIDIVLEQGETRQYSLAEPR
jgi:beta-galactosidase